MAWAVVDDVSGEGVAVAMHAGMLSVGNGQRLVEISDDAAASVLTGRSPARYVLGRPAVQTTPAPVQHIPTPQRRQMAYTTRYPAMLSDDNVATLARISSWLPPQATVVEIGSRLGGSARVILDAAPSIRRMYCIDIDWQHGGTLGMEDPNMEGILRRWNTDGHTTTLAFALKYLSAYPCVRLLGRRSPYDIAWWSETVDMVFEDSEHCNPQFSDNIWFWWDRLASGAVMCGHDYQNQRFPDVTTAVTAFSEVKGVHLYHENGIWWMHKP